MSEQLMADLVSQLDRGSLTSEAFLTAINETVNSRAGRAVVVPGSA